MAERRWSELLSVLSDACRAYSAATTLAALRPHAARAAQRRLSTRLSRTASNGTDHRGRGGPASPEAGSAPCLGVRMS